MQMKIKGTITHVPLSGGFWGITADNGQKFRPVHALAQEFQQEGLTVEAIVEPAQVFSIFMWGTDVEITSIQKIH
jgi:hypothetical protein